MSPDRDDSPDRTATTPLPATGVPEVSQEDASQAMTEGAGEAVADEQASESLAELPPAGSGAPGEEGAAAVDEAPPSARSAVEPEHDTFGRRPEIFAGGAFVGGLVLAKILKRFGSDD